MNTFSIFKTVLLFTALTYKTLVPCECDTKVTGVNLVVNTKNETNDYSYSKSNNTHTFTPKDNKKFKSVKHGSKIVWYTDYENQYATKVELGEYGQSDTLDLIIHIGTTTKKLYKVGNAQWTEVDSAKKVGAELNISATGETCYWTAVTKQNLVTFTAKKGFGFKKVVEKHGNNTDEIWKGANDAELSLKVEYHKTNKTVTVHLGEDNNATTKLFKKGSDNKWAEDKSAKSTAAPKPASTAGSGTASSGLVSGGRKRTAITLSIDATSSNQYTTNRGGNSISFTCNQGFMFDKVVAGSEVLWQAHGGACAKGLTVDRSSGTPKVTNVQLVGND